MDVGEEGCEECEASHRAPDSAPYETEVSAGHGYLFPKRIRFNLISPHESPILIIKQKKKKTNKAPILK